MMEQKIRINVIGAGLAGSEASFYLANKGYKVLTSEGDINSYGGFSRVTYIDNVIMGYVQERNAFYSFDKTTKEYFDKIKLG